VETSAPPAMRASARATSDPGIRTPTVPEPAVIASERAGRAGSTSVSGPGHRRSASRAATPSSDATRSTCSRSAATSGRGLPSGRSFAAARRASAAASEASAPSP
jgi:hypothetical protein